MILILYIKVNSFSNLPQFCFDDHCVLLACLGLSLKLDADAEFLFHHSTAPSSNRTISRTPASDSLSHTNTSTGGLQPDTHTTLA